MGSQKEKTICTISGSKHVKSAMDVPFGGLPNNFHPHQLQIQKILITKDIFCSKQILVEAPPKFTGNSPWGFQILG